MARVCGLHHLWPRQQPVLFGSIRVNVQSELTSQSGECELWLVVNPCGLKVSIRRSPIRYARPAGRRPLPGGGTRPERGSGPGPVLWRAGDIEGWSETLQWTEGGFLPRR
jgi:hypothetical protein